MGQKRRCPEFYGKTNLKRIEKDKSLKCNECENGVLNDVQKAN